MNIILGEETANSLRDRYIVLELDTFIVNDEIIKSYCTIEGSAIGMVDQLEIFHWSSHHQELIDNYRKQNWNFCEQMIEHIKGKWNGELDSFYDNLYSRVQENKQSDLPRSWTGYIERN